MSQQNVFVEEKGSMRGT